jgi:chromosomal replication initiator protein
MNAEQAWQAALGELELQLTKATFDTWLKNTHVVSCEDNTFLIGVQNGYAKDWLENRLLTTIKRTLTSVVNHAVSVRFVVRPRRRSRTAQEPSLLEMADRRIPSTFTPLAPETPHSGTSTELSAFGTGLSPQYTFDTFIVGRSNRLANAAAMAVAENPGRDYNPLFIYGGVGLGKTHLLHAIGNLAAGHGLQVLYVSSETFTNDLINAIRTQSTEQFRTKYRDYVDVLLVDDIQFIGGKESTQEEFFHTFNALHEVGKQIAMSSDRPPKAIVTLEERLRSRFEWGLIADIQPPDLETRTAILQSKAESQGLVVPSEVIDFIASEVHSNIRELEGALNRVVALARLLHLNLTVDVAASALEAILTRAESITPGQVLDAVSKYYNMEVSALKGRKRSHDVALARHVAMYLMREDLHCSLPHIGEILGGRDHTTVIYGCDKITLAIGENDDLRRDVVAIKERLYKTHMEATH